MAASFMTYPSVAWYAGCTFRVAPGLWVHCHAVELCDAQKHALETHMPQERSVCDKQMPSRVSMCTFIK